VLLQYFIRETATNRFPMEFYNRRLSMILDPASEFGQNKKKNMKPMSQEMSDKKPLGISYDLRF